jgi:hypothetical protein
LTPKNNFNLEVRKNLFSFWGFYFVLFIEINEYRLRLLVVKSDKKTKNLLIFLFVIVEILLITLVQLILIKIMYNLK